MKYQIAVFALLGALAVPAIGSAQTKTPGSAPLIDKSTPSFKAGADLSGKVNLVPLADGVWGGKVCMSSVELANDGATKKTIDKIRHTKEKTTGDLVVTNSGVEVLNAGDSIELLNYISTFEKEEWLYVAPPTSTKPALHGYGTVCGLPNVAMLVQVVGNTLDVTLGMVDDPELLELMPVEDIFSVRTDPSGHWEIKTDINGHWDVYSFGNVEVSGIKTDIGGFWEFTLDLIAPIVMEIAPTELTRG